jgi:hypothetical protein
MVCPVETVPHSGRVLRRALHVLALYVAVAAGMAADEAPGPALLPPAGPPLGGRYAQVTVNPTKTSIYIGSISLTMPPFARRNGVYQSEYKAKVFPFFFSSESGSISIEFSDDNLHQLLRGETVYFKGRAHNSNGDERRIEGRAVPEAAGADHGKIKVRVWVSKRIELIFNTVYRFTGKEQ